MYGCEFEDSFVLKSGQHRDVGGNSTMEERSPIKNYMTIKKRHQA